MNVEAWSTELGLEQYSEAFAENAVDWAESDNREIDNAPGTVAVLRGPGFLDSDKRPFHTITETGAPRLGFGLRQQREAAKR